MSMLLRGILMVLSKGPDSWDGERQGEPDEGRCHSQLLSFIMCASSMMNLPSLYF